MGCSHLETFTCCGWKHPKSAELLVFFELEAIHHCRLGEFRHALKCGCVGGLTLCLGLSQSGRAAVAIDHLPRDV